MGTPCSSSAFGTLFRMPPPSSLPPFPTCLFAPPQQAQLISQSPLSWIVCPASQTSPLTLRSRYSQLLSYRSVFIDIWCIFPSLCRALENQGFEIIERGEIEVKGKGKMTTYFLIQNLNASEDEIMGRSQTLLHHEGEPKRGHVMCVECFFY